MWFLGSGAEGKGHRPLPRIAMRKASQRVEGARREGSGLERSDSRNQRATTDVVERVKDDVPEFVTKATEKVADQLELPDDLEKFEKSLPEKVIDDEVIDPEVHDR
ncbi:hypothetical protein AXG93_3457s1240 [Marchantia polymorpha subsp. ruderalis]|uniref:Uncharacterized protein n=1 Tax=Marchantia polymorpha subsp. ruderalis TaxID=1480154 RepID=A0A176VZE7_MARPO|nr:hypothetical protein AXG93_3457s1240 [Marchantia polymorpha subsp. ruderalis]